MLLVRFNRCGPNYLAAETILEVDLSHDVPATVAKGGGAATMDTIVMIMFASVICTMTALSFMELRRIRKRLESPKLEPKAESK